MALTIKGKFLLTNGTSAVLKLLTESASAPEINAPPVTIAANSTVPWDEETSNAKATSISGSCTYDVKEIETSVGTVNLTWTISSDGTSNSYTQSAPAGYTVTQSGGDGKNPTVTWTLSKD